MAFLREIFMTTKSFVLFFQILSIPYSVHANLAVVRSESFSFIPIFRQNVQEAERIKAEALKHKQLLSIPQSIAQTYTQKSDEKREKIAQLKNEIFEARIAGSSVVRKGPKRSVEELETELLKLQTRPFIVDFLGFEEDKRITLEQHLEPLIPSKEELRTPYSVPGLWTTPTGESDSSATKQSENSVAGEAAEPEVPIYVPPHPRRQTTAPLTRDDIQAAEAEFRSSLVTSEGLVILQKPSETTDMPWLYAHDQTKTQAHNIVYGKWMLFGPKIHMDTDWAIISRATQRGFLGSSSKISTVRDSENSDYVICVYTTEDILEQNRILAALRSLGWRSTLRYKRGALHPFWTWKGFC